MDLKWGSSTFGSSGGRVTWSFAPANAGQFFKFDAKISEADYQAAVRTAFKTWSDVADITFAEVSDSASAQIRLGWDTIDGAYQVVGQATYNYNWDNVLQKAEVRFDLDENWTSKAQSSGDQLSFLAVAIHEIGHAIGLEHSDREDSIMYPTLYDQAGLTRHDIEDIREIYGAAKTTVPVSSGDQPTAFTPVQSSGATFSGERMRYDIRVESEDVIIVRDLGPGTSFGAEHRLVDVERVTFSDGTLAFDFDGESGQAYRLYQAAFDRAPDVAGLGFWVDALDEGKGDMIWMAKGFIGSNEFLTTYGAPTVVSEADFIGLLYENVLNRTPADSEVSYWAGRFDGANDRAELLAFFSDSAENRANVQPAIEDGIWYV